MTKLVSQDRNISVEIMGGEEYFTEEVWHNEIYFGTNLWVTTGIGDRIFLGTFEDKKQCDEEIERINSIVGLANYYMITTPDLLV